ncbi:unnamed protein product [Calicophoron daubneyi]|uniref:Uncharacterized protein n=1 Tax=Calicophoron daubneyi TaxID=300641 RepID=A0AAV2TD84_CALDB
MGSNQSTMTKQPVEITPTLKNDVKRSKSLVGDHNSSRNSTAPTSPTKVASFWHRIWRRSSSIKSNDTNSPTNPSPDAPLSVSLFDHRLKKSEPQSPAPEICSTNRLVPVRVRQSSGRDSGHHRFQITSMSPRKQSLLQDLRNSSLPQMECSTSSSPIPHDDEGELLQLQKPIRYPSYQNRKTTQKSNRYWEEEELKMRFVRGVPWASSVPDLSKEPKRSALKNNKDTDHSSMAKLNSDLHEMPISPLVQPQNYLSTTPPVRSLYVRKDVKDTNSDVPAMASSAHSDGPRPFPYSIKIRISSFPSEASDTHAMDNMLINTPERTSSPGDRDSSKYGQDFFDTQGPNKSNTSPKLHASNSPGWKDLSPLEEFNANEYSHTDSSTPKSERLEKNGFFSDENESVKPILPANCFQARNPGPVGTTCPSSFSDKSPTSSRTIRKSVERFENNHFDYGEVDDSDNEKSPPITPQRPRFHNLIIRRDSLGRYIDDSGNEESEADRHTTHDYGEDENGFIPTEDEIFEEYSELAKNDYSCTHSSSDESGSFDEDTTPAVPIVEVLPPSLCEAGYGRAGRYLERWLPQKAFCERLLLSAADDDGEVSWARRKSLLGELRRSNEDMPTEEMLFLRFSQFVQVTELEPQDRTADKPWTRLTPTDKALIRQELNDFKMSEMTVHEQSRQNTRFHLI